MVRMVCSGTSQGVVPKCQSCEKKGDLPHLLFISDWEERQREIKRDKVRSLERSRRDLAEILKRRKGDLSEIKYTISIVKSEISGRSS